MGKYDKQRPDLIGRDPETPALGPVMLAEYLATHYIFNFDRKITDREFKR